MSQKTAKQIEAELAHMGIDDQETPEVQMEETGGATNTRVADDVITDKSDQSGSDSEADVPAGAFEGGYPFAMMGPWGAGGGFGGGPHGMMGGFGGPPMGGGCGFGGRRHPHQAARMMGPPEMAPPMMGPMMMPPFMGPMTFGDRRAHCGGQRGHCGGQRGHCGGHKVKGHHQRKCPRGQMKHWRRHMMMNAFGDTESDDSDKEKTTESTVATPMEGAANDEKPKDQAEKPQNEAENSDTEQELNLPEHLPPWLAQMICFKHQLEKSRGAKKRGQKGEVRKCKKHKLQQQRKKMMEAMMGAGLDGEQGCQPEFLAMGPPAPPPPHFAAFHGYHPGFHGNGMEAGPPAEMLRRQRQWKKMVMRRRKMENGAPKMWRCGHCGGENGPETATDKTKDDTAVMQPLQPAVPAQAREVKVN